MTSDMKPVDDRMPIAATEGRKVDWIDVTGWGVFKGHAMPVDVGRFIAEKINLYAADQIAALQADVERLREALGPFAEASDTAAKIADIHGENEFVLCFGPVPVGVIPLKAFIAARAALNGGSDAAK